MSIFRVQISGDFLRNRVFPPLPAKGFNFLQFDNEGSSTKSAGTANKQYCEEHRQASLILVWCGGPHSHVIEAFEDVVGMLLSPVKLCIILRT